MTLPFPEPTTPVADRREVLLGYLDFFRQQVLAKVGSLPEDRRRRSGVPSGWTAMELVRHLTFVERRWLDWGFEGAPDDDPFGDERDGRWFVDPSTPWPDLAEDLLARGRITARIARRHGLTGTGADGPRWEGHPPATLERVLLHLLQEYARHLGQLDVVVELAGGATGE